VQSEAVLRYESSTSEGMIVRVYDMSGKTLRTQTVRAVIGFNQFYVNTATLASGIYMLELQNSYERRTVRMVKQ
ncbi:MAG TPA: T9SS type A sorting domain-containing protein, partial [Flavisolibacter sp.]|nr:T9SS type A sorting domain-containing protein [Flavisolibacter sp.]